MNLENIISLKSVHEYIERIFTRYPSTSIRLTLDFKAYIQNLLSILKVGHPDVNTIKKYRTFILKQFNGKSVPDELQTWTIKTMDIGILEVYIILLTKSKGLKNPIEDRIPLHSEWFHYWRSQILYRWGYDLPTKSLSAVLKLHVLRSIDESVSFPMQQTQDFFNLIRDRGYIPSQSTFENMLEGWCHSNTDVQLQLDLKVQGRMDAASRIVQDMSFMKYTITHKTYALLFQGASECEYHEHSETGPSVVRYTDMRIFSLEKDMLLHLSHSVETLTAIFLALLRGGCFDDAVVRWRLFSFLNIPRLPTLYHEIYTICATNPLLSRWALDEIVPIMERDHPHLLRTSSISNLLKMCCQFERDRYIYITKRLM